MNNPKHYKINGIDTMDFILSVAEANKCNVREAFYLCNCLKYLIRYGRKNGLKDLYKAEDYLCRLIHEKQGKMEYVDVSKQGE